MVFQLVEYTKRTNEKDMQRIVPQQMQNPRSSLAEASEEKNDLFVCGYLAYCKSRLGELYDH